MKIDTAEKYAKRFERRGAKRRPKTTIRDVRRGYWKDDTLVIPGIAGIGSKPNHAARAVSLEDVYAGVGRVQKPAPWFPNVGGIRIVGTPGSCDRNLIVWSEEVGDPNKPWETKYFAYAYPCHVDHGMQQHRGAHTRFDLVPVTGKKGEHRDSNGRTW